jgi:hypothetical protein
VNGIAQFLVAGMLAIAGISAHAVEPPPFEGHSGADSVLKRDALSTITQLFLHKAGCSVIDRVDARPLGPGELIPPSISLPRATSPVTWEHWSVTACHKERAFVVALWIVGDTQMTFALGEVGQR